MKKIAMVCTLVVLQLAAVVLEAQTPPAKPGASPERAWLQKLVGEWETEVELAEPGKPVKVKGTDSVRRIGGSWIISEGRSQMMGAPFTNLLTLGYDPQKKKYIGTEIDSISDNLRLYEGTVDAEGKILTLEAQIPSPHDATKLARIKEVIELRSEDHRVVTLSMQREDGQWLTLVTIDCRRKK